MPEARWVGKSLNTIKDSLNVKVPVLFIHEGSDILVGASNGGALIFNARTQKLMQTLQHGQGISFHCNMSVSIYSEPSGLEIIQAIVSF